jgi:mono/diheme cytochrome c family protein
MAADRRNMTATLFVIGGVLLALLLAALITQSIPGRQASAVPAKATSPIDYSVLDRGTNLADLERGRVYYVQLCVSCHGSRGDGLGEWAYRVTPLPRDLTSARVQQRSDEYLFSVISNGLAGTAMTGWKDQLSEPQRRQLVTFLRYLGMQQTRDRRVRS